MKKDPRLLEENELLAVLEEKTVDKPEEYSDHSAIQFLADFGIYPGTSKVSGTILYNLYKNANPKNHVNSIEFHTLLKGYLEHTTDKKERITYLLNRDTRTVTLELAKFLRNRKPRGMNIDTKEYRKHFEKFLARFVLKPGEGRIPAVALYFFYDKWKYNEDTKNKLNLNYMAFNRLIKIYFKTLKTKYYNSVVKIDREFFKQFTEDEIKIALEWAKKYSEKKQPNKKKIPEGEEQTF